MENLEKEKIKQTFENLRKNNFEVYYAENKEAAKQQIFSLIEKGQSVAMGGSMTLKELGVPEMLRCGDYRYLDRSAPEMTPEKAKQVMREAFFSDVYLTSANAITETGNLYCVDGNGNRVAAMIFGPESVICVAGINKIVPDIDSAIRRVKEIAAPANTVRLSCDTFCRHSGHCVSLERKMNSEMCDGCGSDSRVCCDYVVFSRQRIKNRIKVILVNEKLGY